MVMKIIKEPDLILRRKAKPIKKFSKRIKRLVTDMLETMYDAKGVGLAAPQVGVGERVIVVDIGEDAIAVVNPEITFSEGAEKDVEGCLSIPGVNGYVTRKQKITVKGFSPDGAERIYHAEGLLARVFQHEIDHLNGVLFIDYLSKEEGVESIK
mgnify:CR=1 FL=1